MNQASRTVPAGTSALFMLAAKVDGPVRQAGQHPAGEIENGKLERAPSGFNNAAEDNQEVDVAGQVHDAGVHEQRSRERGEVEFRGDEAVGTVGFAPTLGIGNGEGEEDGDNRQSAESSLLDSGTDRLVDKRDEFLASHEKFF